MVTNFDIARTLDLYCDRFPERSGAIADLRTLITSGVRITSRREPRGHVTCGALVLDEKGHLLVVRHRALNRWLMPGGHLEELDATLAAAASRELSEELGVSLSEISILPDWKDIPVDIDRHTIPESPLKGEPMHEHWDFRFVVTLRTETGALQLDEVTAVAWVDPAGYSKALARTIADFDAWERRRLNPVRRGFPH